MKHDAEGGYASILVLGMCVLCFAIAGLAVDGMRLLLERRSLQGLVDSAARAGASRLDRSDLYRNGATARLDGDQARARILEMLARRPGSDATISVSSTGVRVEVRATVEPTFLRAVGIGALPVRASAQAEPVFGEP